MCCAGMHRWESLPYLMCYGDEGMGKFTLLSVLSGGAGIGKFTLLNVLCGDAGMGKLCGMQEWERLPYSMYYAEMQERENLPYSMCNAGMPRMGKITFLNGLCRDTEMSLGLDHYLK